MRARAGGRVALVAGKRVAPDDHLYTAPLFFLSERSPVLEMPALSVAHRVFFFFLVCVGRWIAKREIR